MGGLGDASSNEAVVFGPFQLCPAERLLKKADEPVHIGGRALDILITLVGRAGEVVSHRELIARAWPDVTVEETNLRVHVAGLRNALGEGHDGARYVVNVPGRGYCFVAPVTRATAPSSAQPADPVSTDRHQRLPARHARMVGRDDTIRVISAELMTGRLVSVVGAGGIGKTTVAVSIAHALLDIFDGAVIFVDLAALTDPELVPTAVASALGLVLPAHDPLLGLLDFLGDKRFLVVLDNCEHVIDAAAAVAERLVREAPHVHILATSREALRAEGESVHLLFALDMPPEDAGLNAADALRYSAVQLFMERAAASGHRSELNDGDAPLVAKICRRLDGIALAIELVASRVGSHGIRGTAELLDNRFGLLWQGRRTALPRHKTLNAMLDWSYNLLSDYDKMALCRLSVFVGEFTLEAASWVTSDTQAADANATLAVASLVEKSLLSSVTINERSYYRLLDTTRAYAAAKLAQRGEADHVARRHAISYVRLLQDGEAFQPAFREVDPSEYAAHVGNVRAALEWAFSDHGDVAVGIELAAHAAPLFIGLSSPGECRFWCERALSVRDRTSCGTEREINLLEALAISSMFTKGNSEKVGAAIERALELVGAFEDRSHQLRLLTGKHAFLIQNGDFHSAMMVAEQSSAIAHATQNTVGLMFSELMLGPSHHTVGNQAEAQAHCELGMTYAAALGISNLNFFGYDLRIPMLSALARTLWLRGYADQALRIAERTVDEGRSQDNPVSVSVSLSYATTVLLWVGDLQRADDFIGQLIAYAGRYSLDPYRGLGIALKGQLAISLNDPEAGAHLLRSGLEVLRAVRHNIMLTPFSGSLAEGLSKVGQFEEALFTVKGAITHATSSGGRFHLAELLRLKAQILTAMPQPDRASAIHCLQESVAVAREQSALAFELRSAIDLARLLSESGRGEQAHGMLSLVYGQFTQGFETSDLRTARNLISDLAEPLRSESRPSQNAGAQANRLAPTSGS